MEPRKRYRTPWKCRSKAAFTNYQDSFGFIYQITCVPTGERYIGKKSFHVYRGKKRLRESSWRHYKGSSEEVKALMLDHPLSSFEFRILFIAKTKAIWSHAESNILHKLDCLTLTTSDGYPAYLNKRVNEVKWIAKDYPHAEIEDVVNYLIRERNRERNK